MIVFDLECAAGHKFEGWFDDLDDLERQLLQDMVRCPHCGGVQVRRVPSTFGLSRCKSEPSPEDTARLLGLAFQRYLHENFDDVGANFASEALKIHYGVAEPRNIRGVSSAQEEQMLQQEGVGFFKLGQPEAEPTDDADNGED